MGLVKCKECGKEISENASCCVNCGNPIIKYVTCEECGEKISENAKICPNCGIAINNYSKAKNDFNNVFVEDKSCKKNSILNFIIFLVLIIQSAALLFIFVDRLNLLINGSYGYFFEIVSIPLVSVLLMWFILLKRIWKEQKILQIVCGNLIMFVFVINIILGNGLFSDSLFSWLQILTIYLFYLRN